MIKLKDLINEDLNYDVDEDFFERRNRELFDIISSFKKSGGNGIVRWKRIPASLLKKVWLYFGKRGSLEGSMNDDLRSDLNKIQEILLTNIARLNASNGLCGHDNHDVRREVEDDFEIKLSEEEYENLIWNYLHDKDSNAYISDYGLPKLEALYSKIFTAKTDEEKIMWIDQALNVVHQRGDLASMFVEGGTKTLNDISNQGGYTSEK